MTVGTLNVVTMPGKARELANMMERRKVEVFVCAVDLVEGKPSQEHWNWIQIVLQW